MEKVTNLTFYEAYTLLALRDREGTLISATEFPYVVGAAVAAELLYNGRIEIDAAGRKPLATVFNTEPTGDLLLDEWLQKMSQARRRSTLETWVTRIAGTRKLKDRIAEQLVRKGIVRTDEKSVLFVFTQTVYPEVNPEPERRLLECLHEVIFTETPAVDPWTVVLLSLAHSGRLLPVLFGKKEIQRRQKRIVQIVKGELTGKAARQAIEAVEAAIIVAAILPVVVAGVVHANN